MQRKRVILVMQHGLNGGGRSRDIFLFSVQGGAKARNGEHFGVHDTLAICRNWKSAVMVALLVVEDHVLVREGLVQTLRQLETGVLVSEAADCAGATKLLEAGRVFDLMVLDLGLPGLDGLSYLKTLRKNYPDMRVLILSAFDDPLTVDKAMRSGAAGFVPKTCSSDRLLDALRTVLAGGVFTPDVSSASSAPAMPHMRIAGSSEPAEFGLSDRQAEVLGLMARGESNRRIAEILGLTEGTVKIHLSAIFKVLGVSSRTQAMVVISRQGIRL